LAARIDSGWCDSALGLASTGRLNIPSVVSKLVNLNVKTTYLDGELCGFGEAEMPSFAHTRAATDGKRGVHLEYAFDLLHLTGWVVSNVRAHLLCAFHRSRRDDMVTTSLRLRFRRKRMDEK
jgi:ATP-dependent DNA ligase